MSKKVQDNKQMAFLPRLTLVVAKIAEVVHWWLAGMMLVGALVTLIWPTVIVNLAENLIRDETVLSCYGFETAIINTDGMLRLDMIFCFAVGSTIVLSLMAMIFRNVYLILKTAQGKTWFAKGDTPFQQNIVRMFREIGIFFIAISVMSLISEIIVNFTGGELVSGFNYLSCFIGLVFLCISQFFNYGAGLEEDLDGLV